MPTYLHECTDPACGHMWEDEYSIKQDPPKICPKCNKETAKRLIAAAVGGKVELYGQELVSKLKEDGAKLKRQAGNSEKLYANLLGEQKYNEIQSNIDKARKG